jgi:hypothetical protein
MEAGTQVTVRNGCRLGGSERDDVVLTPGGPILPRSPNWSRTEFTTSPGVGDVAAQAATALREVFGLRDGDELFVKLFSSPLRGHTPASPTYKESRRGG